MGRGAKGRAAIAAAMAIGLSAAAAGPAAGAEDHAGHGHGFQGEDAPEFDRDARTGRVAPSAAQRSAAAELGSRVRWNDFGTPSSLIRHGGYLATGLDASDAPAAARAFLTANRELFRLTPEGVADLELVNDAPLGEGRAVLLRQRFGSLKPTQDGLVAVGVARGRITYVSSSLTGDAGAPPEATLTAVDAFRRAAADVGREVGPTGISAGGLRRGWFEFGVQGSSDTQRARLVAIPTPRDGVRAAWETLITDYDDGTFMATHFVDARTGEVLLRTNRVQHAQAQWEVFPANPPLDPNDSTDTRQLWCWQEGAGCERILGGPEPTKGTPERTGEWDSNQLSETGPAPSTNTVDGNAAQTTENWENFSRPTRPGQRATSPTRQYTSDGARATWTNNWYRQRCDPATAFLAVNNQNDILAATTNLFAQHNRMHDFSYQLGFTEQNYNLQRSNYGRAPTDRALDEEFGNAQAGAVTFGQPTFMGRDNANQATPPDGQMGRTNMYLWQPIAGAFYSPCVDGDYDMSVIGHEYTHAISNRMVAGPDQGLRTREGGSMGESWSDLVAVEYLNEYGLVPTSNENPFSVGAYVTGDREAGIRNYGMNRSPLNYSNVGYDLTGAQVHSDGEIWSATNFDIRSALAEKYDGAFPASDQGLQVRCADGEVPADRCPGNRRWVQIVFDAFLLMQADVSMVDARDAYLAADMTRFGGANQRELWEAFARRGLGERAAEDPANVQVTGTPPVDVTPRPSFESPLTGDEGVLSLEAVGLAGGPAPQKAQLFLGAYEARTTPVADSDPETKDIGTEVALLPGTYDFIVRADGFGARKLRRTVTGGERGALRVELPANLASGKAGASVSGNAGGTDSTDEERAASLAALIDDTEATTWASFAGSEDETAEDDQEERPRTVEGRNFTVDLAGGAQTVGRVQVSSLLRSANPNDSGGDNATQNRFSALRKFEILTCVASAGNGQCGAAEAFRSIYTSPDDAFPSVRPRTRVPELTLRSFDVPDTEATHVRLRVLTNQCTGAPDYQGDQDADPANNSDCSEGRPILIASQGDIVRAAELQVFGPEPAAGPGGPTGPISGPGGPSGPAGPTGPGGPGAAPKGCVAQTALASAGARRRGRGVAFAFTRRAGVTEPVTVDVFRQSRGRRVLGERLVRRFRDRTAAFAWDGRDSKGRRVGDGFYFARFRVAVPGRGTDTARITLGRSRGRFTTRRAFFRRDSCAALGAFKLSRPVFGGTRSRALGIAYRLNRAGRVALTVTDPRGRVVRRVGARSVAPGRFQRLTVPARGLRRGAYRVRLTLTEGGRTSTATLVSTRL